MEFILVTEKESKQKICVATDKINSIVQCLDGTAFLETSFYEDGNSVGIYTVELFDTIANCLNIVKMGGKSYV